MLFFVFVAVRGLSYEFENWETTTYEYAYNIVLNAILVAPLGRNLSGLFATAKPITKSSCPHIGMRTL
jgi:hypothetical protein